MAKKKNASVQTKSPQIERVALMDVYRWEKWKSNTLLAAFICVNSGFDID